jgi:hypothetical protein
MIGHISRIHNDDTLCWTYVSPAKYRDDVDDFRKNYLKAPRMDVVLYKNGTFDDNSERITLYATPKIVEEYTGIDFFKILQTRAESFVNYYSFSIQSETLVIDFDIEKGEYPFLSQLVKKKFDDRDYFISPVVEYPIINKIYKFDDYHSVSVPNALLTNDNETNNSSQR